MALLAAAALGAALIAPVAPADTTPEQRVAPATSAVTTLRAADPERGQPAWTLRLARSQTGLQCSTVGQVRDGEFGLVGLDGAFRALPEANVDACGEPGALLGERVFAARRVENVRTVVYGVAGAGIARVTVAVAGGRPRVVPHTDEGAFVAVLRRYPEDAQPVVTIARADGSERTETFTAKKGFVVADPFGGRAWRLQAFGFGDSRVGCVSFATARAVPGEPNVSSTLVCGRESRRAVYFATRRQSGAGPSRNFLAGNWNHHPARLAVYGLARGAKRIVVRAGARRIVTAPRLNGGFLVFLPLSVRPASVRVVIDGKRHGSSFGTVTPPRQLRASAASVPVGDVAPGRTDDGRYAPGWVQYRVTSSKLAVTLDDPAGGLPWVLRQFDADRVVVERATRSLAGARRVGRSRCVQLGRLRGATVGWVYGDGRFRPVGTEYPLLQCTALKRQVAVGTMASTLGLADVAAPTITGSVVWGYIPGAKEATVSGAGSADGAATVNDGAFLRLGGADARGGAVTVSGGAKTLRIGRGRLPSAITRGLTFPTILAGSDALEAPAPDPSGGPHWAMQVAQTEQGVPCVAGPSRVVGDRAGGVDLRLALFTGGGGLSSESCRPLEAKPNAERPCDIGWGGGNAEELEGQDDFLAQARTQRRLLAGRTMVSGQCGADVERVTLRTPRDVRTLVPSATGRAVLAVFDGDFVDGELVLTYRLRGGKSVTERHPFGF
jgi:hypothetical protein